MLLIFGWGCGPDIQTSETPASIRRVAPEIGEHTEEILLETGYSWDDIGKLQDKGVIL